MTERTNRRDLILETASTLFVRQGYHATSVRQIADEVGCTEAALYYHFKEGKRALLREIVEVNMPDLFQAVMHCENAASLPELVQCFGVEMSRLIPLKSDRMRWMLSEFPGLDADERALIHQKYLAFHITLAELIARFVPDQNLATGLAWVLICSHLGYSQLFFSLDMQSRCSFSMTQFSTLLVDLLSAAFPPANTT